jgi:hypothetical protein
MNYNAKFNYIITRDRSRIPQWLNNSSALWAGLAGVLTAWISGLRLLGRSGFVCYTYSGPISILQKKTA